MNGERCIVGIGEILWDIFPSGKQLGGAPANFAYHVTRLGCPGIVVSAVGKDDEYGKEICSVLSEKKVTSIIESVGYPTGRVLVSLDNKGIPQYDIVRNVAWDYISFTEKLKNIAQNTIAVCFGTLAQRYPVSRKTIMEFVDAVPDTPYTYKIFDVNLRQDFYSLEILQSSMQKCNILKINDEELLSIKRLFGYSHNASNDSVCCDIVQKFSLKYLILTCGAAGSFVYTRNKILFRHSPKVEIVDTVGAGDSFTAAFVASLIKGVDVETAHSFAVDVASYVCTQKGAMPEMSLFE